MLVEAAVQLIRLCGLNFWSINSVPVACKCGMEWNIEWNLEWNVKRMKCCNQSKVGVIYDCSCKTTDVISCSGR